VYLRTKGIVVTPKQIVLDAVNHIGTEIIPYFFVLDADVRERLDARYGGPENFPQHESFFAGSGCNWRAEELPGGGFRDIFGVEWQQGNIFHITEPVLKEPSLEGFEFPVLMKDEDLPRLEELCRKQADRFLQFTLGMLFFERAWALRGLDNFLMDLAAEEAFVEELLDHLMQLHLDALDKILELPFDSIRFGDDFGAQRGTIMGAPHWRRYLKPRLAKMYGKVRDAGKIVSIHSCGDHGEILGDLIDLGVQIFNPTQPEANDLRELKRNYGRDITFEGGIGTQVNLPRGTPDEVRAEIREVREVLGPGGGFIMTPTKSLRPEVPTENAAAAVETIIEEARKGTPPSTFR